MRALHLFRDRAFWRGVNAGDAKEITIHGFDCISSEVQRWASGTKQSCLPLSDSRGPRGLHQPEDTDVVNGEPSLEELREQSEQSREALATTVDELRERVSDTAAELKTLVSSAHIKHEFKDCVRGARESFINSVQRKAEENPLQLAAVGAAIAYPAWGLLRAIPKPLLLIGAGLFLTSKKGQQSAQDIKAKIDDVVQQGAERVADAATSIQSDLQDRIDGARYGVEEIRETVSSAAGNVAEKARAKLHDTTDAVKNAAGGVTSMVGGATAASDAGSIMEGAATTAKSSGDAIIRFVNDNALLVAGIGAAVGAFIAASIPASEALKPALRRRQRQIEE